MNTDRLGGWPIPMMITCLVHSAITLLPVHLGKKNEPLHDAVVTLTLVALPHVSPQPSFAQSVFPPKKKPLPPAAVQHSKADVHPPQPVAHPRSKGEDRELQQLAIAQDSPAISGGGAMQAAGFFSDGASSGGMSGTASGPVMLSSELSVICPVTSPPDYPHQSRQLGEDGKLMLRLELDERGRIGTVQVIKSSGYRRLDEAAITVVRTWHCNPPLRNGQPVRAVALQSFSFVLQE